MNLWTPLQYTEKEPCVISQQLLIQMIFILKVRY